MPNLPLWAGLLPAVPAGSLEELRGRMRAARRDELVASLPAPRLEQFAQRPHAADLAVAVAETDRDLLVRAFTVAPQDATARVMSLRDAGAELPPAWARAWAEEEPDEPVALLVAAASLLYEAGGERAGGNDEDLDEFARMSVDANLAWADELCERAARLSTGDPTPWLLRQHALPVGADRAEVLARAARWQELEPLSYAGNVTLVGQLSDLRGGDPDEGLRVAADLSRRTRRQDWVHAVVPVALVDRFVALGAVLGSDEARAEMATHRPLLLSAYGRCVGAPRWRETWLDPALRNVFAFCLYLVDADDEAWDQMRALRGRVTPSPWTLLDEDPMTAWADARAWLARRWLAADPQRLLQPLEAR